MSRTWLAEVGVRGASRLGSLDRVGWPVVRYAFQSPGPVVGELDSRADNEILDGSRHEDLVCLGERGDPGGNVDGKPAQIVCHELALPRMHSAAQLQV